jgi:thiosulfate/3-mercaptopyruvate sulfurtransferase
VRTQIAIASIIVFTLLPGLRSASAQGSSITAKSLLSWMDTSTPPLVLDVRGRSAYRTATAAGAIDTGIDPLGYLPDDSKDPVVLIIPVDADDEFIEAWFKRLANAGHEVWILERGLAAWVEAGGQIENHETTYTLPGSVPFIVPKGLCEGGKPALIFE